MSWQGTGSGTEGNADGGNAFGGVGDTRPSSLWGPTPPATEMPSWGTDPETTTASSSGWDSSGADSSLGWGASSGQSPDLETATVTRVSPGADHGTEESLDTPASAPVVWLYAALVSVSGSIVLFSLTKGATMGVVGWLLSGPVAIGLWAAFLVLDNKRRQSGWYRPSDLADWLRRAVSGLALVGVGLSAFHIAKDVARGVWT